MNSVEIRELSHRAASFARPWRCRKRSGDSSDADLLPFRMFVVATKIGGQVLGAFDDGRMVAFCLAIPGLKPDGKVYLHSHMLGVLPEYRNAGIGRQLKLRQRDDALARGIDLIEWTFDPLEIKNAYFNMERLGAIVRRYVRNQYGVSSSPLHGGLADRSLRGGVVDPRSRASKADEWSSEFDVPADIAEARAQCRARLRISSSSASRADWR